jgi:hypothetical protein
MMERLRAQCALLADAEPNDLIAFLDTDIMVLRCLRQVFEHPFDVGVTIRDRPKFNFERTMPYNNGVIFVRSDLARSALGYFVKKLAVLEELGPPTWAWTGNQLAVLQLLGRVEPGSTLQVGRCRVRVFPCSQYNYTPEGPDERVSGQFILHFRGDAKALMANYARLACAQL